MSRQFRKQRNVLTFILLGVYLTRCQEEWPFSGIGVDFGPILTILAILTVVELSFSSAARIFSIDNDYLTGFRLTDFRLSLRLRCEEEVGQEVQASRQPTGEGQVLADETVGGTQGGQSDETLRHVQTVGLQSLGVRARRPQDEVAASQNFLTFH